MQQITAEPGFSETSGFVFAGFRLEADGTLLRGDRAIHLPPKELAALRFLVTNPARVVTPQELRQALWGDINVTADSIPKCMSSLRALLEPEECIQTIYKRGYRFVAEVRSNGHDGAGTPPRLAILPFQTGYGVPEYLGAMVAEETMARLSGARRASRSAVEHRDQLGALALGQAADRLAGRDAAVREDLVDFHAPVFRDGEQHVEYLGGFKELRRVQQQLMDGVATRLEVPLQLCAL